MIETYTFIIGLCSGSILTIIFSLINRFMINKKIEHHDFNNNYQLMIDKLKHFNKQDGDGYGHGYYYPTDKILNNTGRLITYLESKINDAFLHVDPYKHFVILPNGNIEINWIYDEMVFALEIGKDNYSYCCENYSMDINGEHRISNWSNKFIRLMVYDFNKCVSNKIIKEMNK